MGSDTPHHRAGPADRGSADRGSGTGSAGTGSSGTGGPTDAGPRSSAPGSAGSAPAPADTASGTAGGGDTAPGDPGRQATATAPAPAGPADPVSAAAPDAPRPGALPPGTLPPDGPPADGSPADGLPPGATRRRIPAGDVELCAAELGSPEHPTVVLLHGYPDRKEVWSRVAARLADRFHVVLYDVRGHGESTAPDPLRGGFTLERLTDDFLAVADAVSPDRPVHLVGHDWGSVQGWEFATVARTRGRLASFTSISGPSLDHLGHWIAARARRPTPRGAAHLLGQGAKSWYVYALHVPGLAERAWRGPLGRAWPAILRRREHAAGEDYPLPSCPEDAAHGAWLYRDNVRTRLARPRENARAHVPVQLIVPRGDVFLSERLYDELDRWTPRLTRRTHPGRHWLPRTHPDRLAQWISEFVTETEARAQSGAQADSEGQAETEVRAGAAAETGVAAEAPEPTAASAGPGDTPHTASPHRFGGKLVLVTGAGSGIGRATALAFARAGARVIAVDRDAESAARTAGEARRLGAAGAWAETVDVSDEQAMERLAARTTDAHGVVDVLVNNAGIGLAGPFLDTEPEEWRRLLDVNLWGVIHGCRLFGRRMRERGGGHIVNVASAAAFQPSASLPAYGAAKAAVVHLSACLRAELAAYGIGVSVICPGFVNTAIPSTTRFAGAGEEEERRRREKAVRMYRWRNYPPEKVACRILRAVARDEALVTVTPEAKAVHLMSRFAPGALRRMAKARRKR